MRRLRRRGLPLAYLGVDSQNPTGAMHLYESAGFHSLRGSTFVYEKTRSRPADGAGRRGGAWRHHSCPPGLQSAAVRQPEATVASRIVQAFSRHGYVLAVAAMTLSTLIFLPGRDTFAKGQWALLYLLVILLVASAAGAGPAVLAAVLAFFAWNFFFLPPYHTFPIRDPKDWLSLVAFLVVGVIVGVHGRTDARTRGARRRARAGDCGAQPGQRRGGLADVHRGDGGDLPREIVDLLGRRAATLFLREQDELRPLPRGAGRRRLDAHRGASRGARLLPAARRSAHGAGRRETAGSTCRCAAPRESPACSPCSRAPTGGPYRASETRLVASLANLVGAFLERERLQQAATQAAAGAEADRLKSSLLSSVSHELKTPLAALTATVSNLLESDVHWDEESVRDELRAIVGDVARLNNSIGALLDLSRLEAHAWEPRTRAVRAQRHRRRRHRRAAGPPAGAGARGHPRRDLVVRRRLRPVGPGHPEPAGERGPVFGEARVTVERTTGTTGVRIWVEDEGPGVPADEHEAVFEKFYRGRSAAAAERRPAPDSGSRSRARSCARTVGRSRVDDVVPHGARFVITLPPAESRPTGEETGA